MEKSGEGNREGRREEYKKLRATTDDRFSLHSIIYLCLHVLCMEEFAVCASTRFPFHVWTRQNMSGEETTEGKRKKVYREKRRG